MRTLSNITDRQEILSRIANLSARDRALWGKMTVNETLCHLSDSTGLRRARKRSEMHPAFFNKRSSSGLLCKRLFSG